MTKDESEGLVILVGVGVAAYLLYRAYQSAAGLVSSGAAAVADAASAASSSVADLFPNNIAQPGGTFTATQADGSQITVPYGWKSGDPVPEDTSWDADFSNAGNF